MSKEKKSLIELSNAGKKTHDKWLVRGVNLKLCEGEIVTLIGPNGSGKSTTAKLALGVYSPDEGAASSKDNMIVGYVPQKLNIDWSLPLSVERFMHLTQRRTDEEISEALNATGTVELKNRQIRNLSGGEFQRVMLARAIARKPELLVLDEPVQGVDFAGEIQIYELIKQVRDKLNCGVLLISHDLHMVMSATDRVICLNGHVCCEGTPQKVANSEEYINLFGERASQSLALYQHHHDHTHLPNGSVLHADGSVTDHCHPDDGHHHKHGGDDHA